MAGSTNYQVELPASPDTGNGGYITGISLTYQPPIQRIPALNGTINVPLVLRGAMQVKVMIPVNGPLTPLTFRNLTGTASVAVTNNAHTFTIEDNLFQTGGSLSIDPVGDGAKALSFSASYIFFSKPE